MHLHWFAFLNLAFNIFASCNPNHYWKALLVLADVSFFLSTVFQSSAVQTESAGAQCLWWTRNSGHQREGENLCSAHGGWDSPWVSQHSRVSRNIIYWIPCRGWTNDSVPICAVGNRVLHLRSSSWMRLTPWRRPLRLLSGGLWRKSLAPPASASSVIILAGKRHRHHSETTVLLRGVGDVTRSLRLFRIIQPLTSRCSKFRFKPLDNQIQEERLLAICEKENLKYSKEVRKANRTVLNARFLAP